LPLKIAQLSRFTPPKDAKDIKARLASGDLDIVVGTHALLAKSIEFRNLGLVIVDEEQHFGVAHKERLKSLKADVHVLTLTANAIPRTLQLALSGVRDLSLITTPPVDRLAVRTLCDAVRSVDTQRGAAARALSRRAEFLRRAAHCRSGAGGGVPERDGARSEDGGGAWARSARAHSKTR
jgi:transcription-repair coupling factor (superfamily II helicase)